MCSTQCDTPVRPGRSSPRPDAIPAPDRHERRSVKLLHEDLEPVIERRRPNDGVDVRTDGSASVHYTGRFTAGISSTVRSLRNGPFTTMLADGVTLASDRHSLGASSEAEDNEIAGRTDSQARFCAARACSLTRRRRTRRRARRLTAALRREGQRPARRSRRRRLHGPRQRQRTQIPQNDVAVIDFTAQHDRRRLGEVHGGTQTVCVCATARRSTVS